MWPFESKETRFFTKVVKDMQNYILSHVPRDQLISLYLAGRILTPDRAPTSDIEIFGFVGDSFDMDTEKKINTFFEENPKFCGGREGVFHAFFMSDFEGRTNGKNKICSSEHSVKLWIKLFKHYPHLWGKRINFRELPLIELDHFNELKEDIKFVEMGLKVAKENDYTWPPGKFRFQAFVKNVYHCARMEAVILKGYKYDIHFYKLIRFLKREEDHIAHKCEYFRRLGEEAEGPNYKKERKAFVLEAEKYIRHLRERIPELQQ